MVVVYASSSMTLFCHLSRIDSIGTMSWYFSGSNRIQTSNQFQIEKQFSVETEHKNARKAHVWQRIKLKLLKVGRMISVVVVIWLARHRFQNASQSRILCVYIWRWWEIYLVFGRKLWTPINWQLSEPCLTSTHIMSLCVCLYVCVCGVVWLCERCEKWYAFA